MKNYILFFILFFVTTGCKKHVSLETVEGIVKTHDRLNLVLLKYKSDSLKLLAAEFLIENLPYYYSYEGKGLESYLKLYEIHGTGLYLPEQVLDSVKKTYGDFNFGQLKVKSDLDIDPEYLIENIEWAFKVWNEQPWGKNVSFNDFCEYILPYRIGDEQLKSWREKIYNQFNPILDSIRKLPNADDPAFVARVLLDSLSKKKFCFTEMFPAGPHIGPDLVDWYSGNCREAADLLTYVFRAVGIPSGCDLMLLRGDANVAHYWNFVLDKYGDSYYCYEEGSMGPVRTYWCMKAKIHRRIFSRNKEAIERMGKRAEEIHPSFRYPNLIDVTRLYSGKYAQVLDIPREMLYENLCSDEVVYLCGPSWMDWLPVDWTVTDKGDISFANVEGGVILRLAVYRDKKLIPITDPFLLDRENRDVYFFDAQEGEKEELILVNKYHQFIEPFAQRMVGGVFEGSNQADFKKKDTLYVVTTLPVRLNNVITLSNECSYRYVRYMGPKNSYCNISEVAFYESPADTIALLGKVIGTSNGKNGDGKHDYLNVFDGDPYTSFDYYLPTGGWAGLDLGRSHRIEKIIYTARNRDNYIRPKDTYELFYSSHGDWVSAGVQVPSSDSLLYTIPKGALLYLRNRTRGSHERVFEYEDGKQKYW